MHYSTGNAINSANPDPNLPIDAQLQGYYVKAGYLMPRKVGIGRLQFFLRYENSKYNLTTGYGNQQWKGGGFNYYFSGEQLKATAELDRITFDKQDPLDASMRDYTLGTVGLQMLF